MVFRPLGGPQSAHPADRLDYFIPVAIVDNPPDDASIAANDGLAPTLTKSNWYYERSDYKLYRVVEGTAQLS